jgi:hypothetical protein
MAHDNHTDYFVTYVAGSKTSGDSVRETRLIEHICLIFLRNGVRLSVLV